MSRRSHPRPSATLLKQPPNKKSSVATPSGPADLLTRPALGLDARARWQSTDRLGLDETKLFVVPAGSQEHDEISAEFDKTLPHLAIDTIERIENGYQHEQFSVHAKAVEASCGAPRSIGFFLVFFLRATMRRLLFHGTDAVECIVNDMVSGFKPLLSGSVTGAIHGDGTYFARDASYSDSYARTLPSGQKQIKMLLVDVMVGRCTHGGRGVK